jgi:flavorubredoxin
VIFADITTGYTSVSRIPNRYTRKGGEMARALMVYATKNGETRRIGEFIAEGLRFEGVEVVIKKAGDITEASDLEGYAAYLFGSPTYHGTMLKSMETLLFRLENLPLRDAVGASFGAFGWSGEAPVRIFDTMKHVFGMKMVSEPLMLKAANLGGALKMAQDYGREVARAIGTD